MVVFVGLIMGALSLLATFGILGIGGAAVTWSITQIIASIATMLAGLVLLVIGGVLMYSTRNTLKDVGEGDIRAHVPLIVSVSLIIFGAILMNPGMFGESMLPMLNLGFFAMGVLATWFFVIPKLKDVEASTGTQLVALFMVTFFFIMSIPGFVLSIGGTELAMSGEGQAQIATGQNLMMPLLSMGSIISPEQPVFGVFLIFALIGIAGLYLIRGKDFIDWS